jgi:hypothetical protein
MTRFEPSRTSKWDSVDVYSASEALRRKTVSIVLEENGEATLSPESEKYSRSFARVRLESFADLQTLGLVPRKIQEQTLRRAIQADDAAAYELVTRHANAHEDQGCGCSGAVEQAKRPPSAWRSAQGMRQKYTQLRRFNHPALARTLSEHYRAEMAWDDPIAALVHRWVEKFDRGVYATNFVAIALLNDITIHRGATLSLDSDMTALYANDVRIHRAARLVQRASYMKIWAASVRSFLLSVDDVAVIASKTVPWHIEH